MERGNRTVAILSGARTPIGGFGGSLSAVAPSELASIASKRAIFESGCTASDIEHSVFGNVIHTEPKDMYLSRVAAMGAGVPATSPALTLNRLCGSGMQAIISAAQSIMLGDCDVALAGGAESMSRAPHATFAVRNGVKMGDMSVTDMLIGSLTDPFGNGHMGVTAENVAAQWGISKEEQDAFAVESHRRAAAAWEAGRFDSQIVPVSVKARWETVEVTKDEHFRADMTQDDLGRLRAVFQKDGSVTAGNASGINDGAAALVLMGTAQAEARGLKPMAQIIGYAHSGVDPEIMGVGPITAVEKLLQKTGLNIDDFDVVESNEAFASQALAVSLSLKLDSEKVNPNGGAIALGHPIGATGAIIVVKLVHELTRRGGGLGLATMCIGGGQGIALALKVDG
ncbi:beta-ketothiolase BktB [Ruegeria hyattellae]|uniref:beta-ketothiolase BktB n=1 Tax=Ruegeria hyattellae TaxID=3233337 RepID=UPI00355B558D